VPKVTTRNLFPECIANLKLPIDAFYRESRSGVNIAIYPWKWLFFKKLHLKLEEKIKSKIFWNFPLFMSKMANNIMYFSERDFPKYKEFIKNKFPY
jgi:hypothetical protein